LFLRSACFNASSSRPSSPEDFPLLQAQTRSSNPLASSFFFAKWLWAKTFSIVLYKLKKTSFYLNIFPRLALKIPEKKIVDIDIPLFRLHLFAGTVFLIKFICLVHLFVRFSCSVPLVFRLIPAEHR
jgi:hypothetical protein